MIHAAYFPKLRIGVRALLALALFAGASLAQASPSNLRVTGVSHNSIRLAWDAGGGAPYTISYFAPPQSEEVFVGTTSGGSWTVGGLRPDTDYVLYVNYNGTSDWLRADARTKAAPPDAPGQAATPTSKPLASTCAFLPPGIAVSGFGLYTQCKRADASGVGDADLIAQGLIDALDVFGLVDAALTVCFYNQGRLKFMDAATAPRAISDLASERRDGYTCGAIDRPGTVVLLEGGDPAPDMADEEAPQTMGGPASVANCRVMATDYLSLRGGPSVYYARIDIIPVGERLSASARTSDWFMVDYEMQRGWVSGDWVRASAGCDAVGAAIDLFLLLNTSPMAAETEDPEEPEAAMDAAPAEMSMAQGDPLSGCNLRAGDIINLRAGPGLEYDVLAEIPFQTVMSASERSGDWFKVVYEGAAGWVNINYVFRRGACG